MIKNIFSKTKLFSIITAAVIVSSCGKNFSDQKPYNASVVADAIKNEADLNTAINGLYSSLRATDFYGRTFAVKGDLMGDQCFLSSANSGRYTALNSYTMVNTDGYASNVWLNSYAAIKNANIIINSGLAATNDNINQLYSEAYAIRGMVYFDLVRNFAKPYSDNPDGAGVPIVLTFDQTLKPTRSTVKQVYAQAIADLTKAISLAKYNQGETMTFASTAKIRTLNSSFISKYAIKAILARVYQNMGDWANAQTYALDVINNSGFSLIPSASLVTYWKGTDPRTDKVETLFEVTSDANNSVADGTLSAIYVSKPNGGSYGDILTMKAMYDSYTSTDTRKNVISPQTRSGQIGTAYYCYKYPPSDGTNYDDVKIIRFSEMYLIAAETYYNLNDATNANKYLNLFVQKRDPNVVYASTGAQILEDILTERGKEFLFEGYRFWDMYRLKRSFVKPLAQDGTNAITQTISVTPATLNMVFPIPQDEILVNPNITQNAGY
jgi:tetratricopeptide (TPR) repeat protein